MSEFYINFYSFYFFFYLFALEKNWLFDFKKYGFTVL